ncbi:MAG TPA: hypothetical protein VMJ66_00490 [Geobacteraceae bacterium]|nr:hypothetical protein [Geobacteraceae bacterium]
MTRGAASIVTALLVAAVLPAHAQDSQERTICDISAQTCQNLVDNLQKRIRKLNREINSGSDKYSAEEMKRLEQKLKDAMALLEEIEARSAANDKGSNK